VAVRNSSGQAAAPVADLLPQEERTLLASLAVHADLDVATVEAHVVKTQSDELGDTQSAGETQVEHGAVANAEARRWVRRV
jgi:hypothetical protein